jgi:hypothetical protein
MTSPCAASEPPAVYVGSKYEKHTYCTHVHTYIDIHRYIDM